MNCTVLCYSTLFYVIFFCVLIFCDIFSCHLPNIQFCLDEPLYRRYKSHMFCSVVSCCVMCCFVLLCSDNLYRLQNSPSAKCCVLLFCAIISCCKIFCPIVSVHNTCRSAQTGKVFYNVICYSFFFFTALYFREVLFCLCRLINVAVFYVHKPVN